MSRMPSTRRGLLLAALAAVLFAVHRSDYLLFEKPENTVRRQTRLLSKHLMREHRLLLLMPFDEPQPVEWVGRGTVQYAGTECEPGRIGLARRFEGTEESHIATEALWPGLGPAYTLSLWVHLERGGDQDLWFTSLQQRRTGLRLRDGRLWLFVPKSGTEQRIGYRFDAYGRWVHLAATVDGAAGQARLYQDGVLMAEGRVELGPQPDHNMEFGKMRWSAVDGPLRGALDEASAWTRALHPDEIRKLARARKPLLHALAPFRLRMLEFAEAARAFIPSALKMLDRFDPRLHEARLLSEGIPELELRLSGSDARHFLHSHEDALQSGRRTARAADARAIQARYNGRTVEARLSLAGSTTRYPAARRAAFLLETPAEHPALGFQRLYLIPPESAEYFYAGQEAAALARTNRLCRLIRNGRLQGLYLYEDFDALHTRPGEGLALAQGPGGHFDWNFTFRAPAPSPLPGIRSDTRSALDAAHRLLACDLQHPWSLREWSWRIRQWDSAVKPQNGSVPALSIWSLLGQNPAPFYLLGDLDLPRQTADGRDLQWSSSDPSIIAPDGRVTRPEGDLPVEAALTATVRGDPAPAAQSFLFRVMPERPRLPALMLHISEPVRPLQRADFFTWYYPPGAGSAPVRLQGVQGTGGGVKHRGLASYLSGPAFKKPFSLRFDEPHHVLDDTETRHLYLIYSGRDALHRKNRLAYDLFRAFAGEGFPRYAPAIAWTEVFVNGDYLGLYDMCSRVRGTLLGAVDNPKTPAASPLMFKINSDASLFTHTRLDGIRQVAPDPQRTSCEGAMRALLAFTSKSDPQTFAREAGRWFDLDNVMDFILLLNFTANEDGSTMNFYLARQPGDAQPFFFIPWDYDLTFSGRRDWQSNRLFNRLRKEVPGFEERLAARWRELRGGVLGEPALDARLRAMADALDGYQGWDLRLVEPGSQEPIADREERFRQRVFQHLRYMDEALGHP